MSYGRVRCGRLGGVEWCVDARFSTGDTGNVSEHAGVCGCVFQEYLQQETFLRVVWEVLALRKSCVICDEHCVHRAAGVAVTLAAAPSVLSILPLTRHSRVKGRLRGRRARQPLPQSNPMGGLG